VLFFFNSLGIHNNRALILAKLTFSSLGLKCKQRKNGGKSS
jgi:hypothetical protein